MRYYLSPQHLGEIGKIRDLPEIIIREIISKIQSGSPKLITLQDVKKLLSGIVKPEVDIDVIIQQLHYLYEIQKHRSLKPIDIYNEILVAVNSKESDSNWSSEETDRWRSLEGVFIELLSMPNFRIVTKAAALLYEYNNSLQDLKIVTDVRPIFDDDAEELVGAIIFHTLTLNYITLEGNSQSFSITIDQNDLLKFRNESDRALKKAITAERTIANQDIKVHIAGAENDNSI